jgi:hypothetical protein
VPPILAARYDLETHRCPQPREIPRSCGWSPGGTPYPVWICLPDRLTVIGNRAHFFSACLPGVIAFNQQVSARRKHTVCLGNTFA